MRENQTILRVFPSRTNMTPADPLAFVGDPPFAPFRPPADEVHVSVAFTWDVEEGERLAEAWGQFYPVVKLGGPAFDSPADEFISGRYIQSGVTFTTRGCDNACPWCLAWLREGWLTELNPIVPGHTVEDNNLLQASRGHMGRVFDMLRQQPQAITFAGGLDVNLIDDWVVERLKELRIRRLFVSADTLKALGPLRAALEKLAFLPYEKVRVYVLVGFGGETVDQARARLEAVWGMGRMPFAQYYRPPGTAKRAPPKGWARLVKTWSRPAIMKAIHRERPAVGRLRLEGV